MTLARDQTPPDLLETLVYVLPGLIVLRDMCRAAGLTPGRAKADEMIQTVRADLKALAPYPFCGHPEKCIPAGRCMREIVCND